MEEKMIERIKLEIERAKEHYQCYGWNESHQRRLEKIDGMLDMLTIVTGKDYYYNADGLHER